MSFPKVTTISLMEEGYKVVRTKKEGLSVKKRGRVIKFDIRVETPKGVLWCVIGHGILAGTYLTEYCDSLK